jgi:hypothetical protein
MRTHTSRLSLVLCSLVSLLLLQSVVPSDSLTRIAGSGFEQPVASAQGIDPVQKIDAGLRALSEAARNGRPPSSSDAKGFGVALDGGRLRVIVESSGGRTSPARTAVQGSGGQFEAEYADLVQILIPAERLLDLAADPRVRYVRPPYPVVPRAVAGQGVGASGATAWHTAGFTGANVKVAVIDGGFQGLQQRKNEGDIPAGAQLVDLCNGQVDATRHGTGVAEIVAEVAPGAQITMYCVGTEVQLGQAKDQAKAAGAHIVSMSLAYFNTSRGDGTGGPGTPDAIVADARNSGILWVNSAGNAGAGEASNGPFTDANTDGFHEWANGDPANRNTVENNAQVCGYLRWDAWPTTAQDFALEVRDPTNFTTLLVPPADNPQTGTQAPVEQTCYTNTTGAAREIAWVIRRVNATQPFPPRFDLNVFNQTLQYFSATSNIDIPATSPSAFAVGAACWQSERLENYSSKGPTIDGRIKPDISAQSVVSSGAYGPWQACPVNEDGQGGFNGTSAAAPHMAGAAALVKGQNMAFTPAQLQAFLEGRVRDMGTPGKDNNWGIGLLTLGTPTTPLPPGTPAVSLQVTRNGANRLLVVMTAATGHTISRIEGISPPVTLSLQTTGGVALPTTIIVNPPAPTFSFVLVKTSGTSAILQMTVTGSWPSAWRTFVGGGPNAWQ